MFWIAALALAAAPIDPKALEGAWVVEAGAKPMFRIEFSQDQTGPHAEWQRPDHFSGDGRNFADVTGPVVTFRSTRVRSDGDDVLVDFVRNADDEPVVIRLHSPSPGELTFAFDGNDFFAPFRLVRVADLGKLGRWDRDATYPIDGNWPTSAEMAALFAADQAERQVEKIDWTRLGKADLERRKRTQELLDSGALQSGSDFYRAAFIFQHGLGADDYLRAHILAMAAMARGNPSASWIASATLDRYLQQVGRKQVFGTQFSTKPGEPTTQEPYDRALVSDALRKVLGVPAQAEQEERRKEIEARVNASR